MANSLTGSQNFKLWLRKTTGTPNPTVDVELWEDGGSVKNLLNDTAITSTSGQLLTAPWDASDLDPDNDGALVECRVVSTVGSAPPTMSVTQYGTGTSQDNSSLAWATVAPAAGDLVILLWMNDGGDNQSGLTNFTRLGTNVGSTVESGVYYRICTGSESGNVFTSESSFGVSAEEYCWQAFKITAATWHGTTPPEMSTEAAATSGNAADPSAIAPSWGAETETLFITWITRDDNDGITAAPTNYTTNVVVTEGGSAGPELGASWRIPSPAVASEDVSAWTVVDAGTDEEFICATIAIRPAASVAVNTVEIGAIEWNAQYVEGAAAPSFLFPPMSRSMYSLLVR